ncbi:helix-turn-helix domain-containing protein [Mycolicibacter icosiumassiliensis]|uniref:helix-turn-helix domain-containing protein n=1 Tax=Mycolicibacter icosiumassiliensis TaxID=1792835 RepID=UPI00389A9077
MSKARVVVLEVVSGHLSVTAAARTYGLSRQHLYRLLARYRAGGLDALEPRSRRPASNPRATSDEIIAAIVLLREKLTADGLDAGPITIQHHLARQGLPVPSTSTIRRVLHHHGLITPQPRKRPRNSYHRFAAEQPNQCWQSDFTHWTLADGTDTEILNRLDDHSRYLLACTAHRRVSGPDVVASFTATSLEFHPATHRRRRPLRQTHAASRQPPTPPRHRPRPRQHPRADPGYRHHRHRHQQNRPPRHRQPPHRPRPQLLAQQTEKPRQKPGQSVTDDATHV